MRSLTSFIWILLGLTFLIIIAWFIYDKYGKTKNNFIDLYNEYNTPCLNYWTTDTAYKETNNMAIVAMSYYEKRNYQLTVEAMQKFEPKLKEEGYYNLYIGISYLNINFNNLAINHLLFALENFKDFSNIHLVKWHLGLAYLKNGQPLDAKEQFEEIVNMNARYSKQAQLLINELNQRQNPFQFVTGIF